MSKATVYEIVTDRIIDMLNKGTVPWQKPWQGQDGMNGPVNLVSKKPYRGINVFMLGCSGFSSSYWLSYKQAQDLGGNVRKGEKSTMAVFWKMIDGKDAEGKDKKIPFLRYYSVFNVEQCENVPYPKAEDKDMPERKPIAEAQAIVEGYKGMPFLQTGESRAYYMPSKDLVNMPPVSQFKDMEAYYATLFHELAHSTGHAKRLNRDMSGSFGDGSYSKEELVAEMACAFLCAHSGIVNSTINNSAAYIASWLKVLKGDSKLVVQAAGMAQRASDYILGVTWEADKPEAEGAKETVQV